MSTNPPTPGVAPAKTGEHADPEIFELLRLMVKKGSSDLHMSSRHKPRVRINGDIVALEEYEVVTPERNHALLYDILPSRNREQFEETGDTDFGLEVPGLARFRANVFRDRHGIGAVFRQIPSKILTADDLKLPKAVREFTQLSKGAHFPDSHSGWVVAGAVLTPIRANSGRPRTRLEGRDRVKERPTAPRETGSGMRGNPAIRPRPAAMPRIGDRRGAGAVGPKSASFGNRATPAEVVRRHSFGPPSNVSYRGLRFQNDDPT
jgi:hypothetical protein